MVEKSVEEQMVEGLLEDQARADAEEDLVPSASSVRIFLPGPTAMGGVIQVNGHPVPHVSRFHLDGKVDDVTQLIIQQVISKATVVEAEAEVSYEISMPIEMDGWETELRAVSSSSMADALRQLADSYEDAMKQAAELPDMTEIYRLFGKNDDDGEPDPTSLVAN